MSVLAALARAYERLPDAPPFGFAVEKIGFVVSLNEDGTVAHVIDLRSPGKKPQPAPILAPQAAKRTVGIAPNFLWDKTAYALGVTAGEGKRTAQEHEAFKAKHREWLAGTGDAGLVAFLRFLDGWTPEQFQPPLWPEEMRDQNVVFALESERLADVFLHDRPAARAAWARVKGAAAADARVCLVSGEAGPVARLHPAIKGVWGAQTAGASLVSYNLDAFTSYGHEQGDNAQVSEAAAFAYTTALNHFLGRDSGHRLQIGDASTVFWADCSDPEVAAEVDIWGATILGTRSVSGKEEEGAERVIEGKLLELRAGRPLAQIEPRFRGNVRFCVLGLAPNAARLAVRLFWEGDFGALAERYAAYLRDIALEPAPERPLFSIYAASLRTAPARRDANGRITFDREAVSSLVSGELLRAVLTGGRFPRGLLPLLVMRVRSDHVLDRIRMALIKGLIVRDMRLEGRLPMGPNGKPMEDYLMRSDPDDPNPARRLGRLFALIERAQLAALGDEINATVKDKFLGAAAATPGRVFPMLIGNAETHHLKRLRNGHSDARWIKDAAHARAVGAGIARDIGLLWGETGIGAPAQHDSEEQGLFFVGYYQERYGKRRSADADGPDDDAAPETGDEE
ncbi:MAG: type I-C CRISPR-associated protein Cas8c/Csd1 [Amaricoccus sp.]|uniref:type I-C CRISPR-associated protein Cas8c/Csd1 n=1 Tax=Amaricoccus sp. TaxID=1872485 RepID=UPI0039E2C4F5